MEQFDKSTERRYFDWFTTNRRQYSALRGALRQEFTYDMCFNEGIQWIMEQPGIGNLPSSLQRLRQDYDLDARDFRSTNNMTTKFVQQAASATEPVNIEVNVSPPDRDYGTEASMRAQLYEDVTNAMIGTARSPGYLKLLDAWGAANHLRGVIGVGGIGLALKRMGRTLNLEGQHLELPDAQLDAFSFNPIKLTLDTANLSRYLDEHDHVTYSDAWSAQKAMRVLGPLLAAAGITDLEKQGWTSKLGELADFESYVNYHSWGRLYVQYKQHSETPGVMVHQVHRKDDTGRFATMDIFLEANNQYLGEEPGKMVWLNPPDGKIGNASPFGGNGLPLVLLHGHRRASSPWSIGDVRMCRDSQKRVNRTQTTFDRQQIQNSLFKYVVDENGMGRDTTPENMSRRITNAPGGIVTWNSGTPERKAQPPFVMNTPAPQMGLVEIIEKYESQMQKAVHRAPINEGATPTHVPLGATQIAREEAGRVLDLRVSGDKRAGESLLTVALGTMVLLVQQGSPGVLGFLRRERFSEDDIGMLADADPYYPACNLTIRDQSIRLRSLASREESLNNAAQLQQITPRQYRREMAMLDSAITEDDRFYASAFARIVDGIVRGGEEWTPMPGLGERGQDLIDAFSRAMLDRRAMQDPATGQRLARAVQSQQMVLLGEAAQLAAAQNPPSAQQGQTGVESGASVDAAGSFDQLMQQMEAQSVSPVM